jgi:NAD(P)-dependent dehydrogenase (short-subunit alcohol dehydrogenase family)
LAFDNTSCGLEQMTVECRRLMGKCVVVTGGASGIGEAAVYRLLDEQAMVVVADIRRSAAEELAARVESMGAMDRFGFSLCDISQEPDIQRALRYAVRRFGRLDCLINNAGTGGAFHSLVDTAVEDWDRTQQVNLRGTFLGIKHAARIMIEQGQGGSIVNVSSLAAISGGTAGSAYSASKAGVLSLTQTAAVQLGKHNIRVNTVIPGAIVTPLLHRNIDPEGFKQCAAEMQPLPVIGTPELVAPAFAFLASDDSRFVSGTSLVVDGGGSVMGQNLYSGSHVFGNAITERARAAGVKNFDHGERSSEPSTVLAQNLDRLLEAELSNEPPRVVVITGVSQGLGHEMCREFRRLGHTVIGCARNSEAMARLQAEFGPPHQFYAVDVADDQQVEQWAQAVLAQTNAPDILLNNAAITTQAKQTWYCSDEDFERILGVNVRGTANVLRHFTLPMMRRKQGVIVNFSSGWGREAAARVAPYCASKWAVEGLTKALSCEVPPTMAVVSLHPGIIQTETLSKSFGEAAALYPKPHEWARVAVPYLLGIGPSDNGQQLSIPGMTTFRGIGKMPAKT